MLAGARRGVVSAGVPECVEAKMFDCSNPLDERYKVDFSDRLPDLDSPGARAFAATDSEQGDEAVYALVQERAVPLRLNVLEELLKEPVDFLTCPLATGLARIESPTGEVERLVTITKRPPGPSLAQKWDKSRGSIDQFIKGPFLGSIALALDGLAQKEARHRAIRPNNIFFGGKDHGGVVLGECFSAPAGSGQPDIFEPLERSLLPPDARGEGDEAADMYALGVTVLTLFLDEMPGEGRGRTEMFHARVSHGSFWALTASKELPGTLSTLLRGLLNDDPTERWTLRDLIQWVDGHAPQRTSGLANWTLSRPVKFAGNTYSDRRILAEALAANAEAGAAYLRDQDFVAWVQQVVASETMTDRIERLIGIGSDTDIVGDPAADGALVAKFCMFLDPLGPVRYCGLSLSIDGIGQTLAVAHKNRRQEDIDAITDLLSSGLMAALAEIAEGHNPLSHLWGDQIRAISSFARKKGPGVGIERVLYELNPALPCQSTRFSGGWAGSIGGALKALDRGLESLPQGSPMLDPHFMAFCASKDKSLVHTFVTLTHPNVDGGQAAVMLMELFGSLQGSQRTGPLKNLSARLAEQAKPVLQMLRNRKSREELAAKLSGMSAAGDLSSIVREVAFTHAKVEDSRAFSLARARYLELTHLRWKLEAGITGSDPEAQKFGAMGSAFVGFVILAVSTLVVFAGR